MQVGFALTILERKGKTSRTGNGKRGDPFFFTHQGSLRLGVSPTASNNFEFI